MALIDLTPGIEAELNGIQNAVNNTLSSSGFTKSLGSALPAVYKFVTGPAGQVFMTVAYSLLMLAFLLEILDLTSRTEMEGTKGPTIENLAKLGIKLGISKALLDMAPTILEAIYAITIRLVKGVGTASAGPSGSLSASQISKIVSAIPDDLGVQLVILLILGISLLIALISGLAANILVTIRYIELYIYLAVAPIPFATFANEDLKHIGKSFLQSFTAVSLQGVFIALVIAFYPLLIKGWGSDLGKSMTGDWAAVGLVMPVLGYSIVFLIALFQTGKWARATVGLG